MKILIADTQRYCKVTLKEIKKILTSGLTPNQWTTTNILNLKRSA